MDWNGHIFRERKCYLWHIINSSSVIQHETDRYFQYVDHTPHTQNKTFINLTISYFEFWCSMHMHRWASSTIYPVTLFWFDTLFLCSSYGTVFVCCGFEYMLWTTTTNDHHDNCFVCMRSDSGSTERRWPKWFKSRKKKEKNAAYWYLWQ